VALAEAQHFGKAAERLHISQPALSQQIVKLERSIGVKLFDRNRHAVKLTQAGGLFLVEARKALVQVDFAKQVAQQAGMGEIGQISVGFVGVVLYIFMPDVVRIFRQRYPGVAIKLQELYSSQQIKELTRHQIDLGVLYDPVKPDSEISLECILEAPLCAVLPHDHPLSKRSSLNLAELSNEPFILVSREFEPALHDVLFGYFQQAGILPDVVQETGQIQTTLGLVASSLGISLMPEFVHSIRTDRISYVPLEGRVPNVRLDLAWRSEDHSEVLQHFIQITREVLDIKQAS
jgi:DNA-binding transcriptional LysR family regulator